MILKPSIYALKTLSTEWLLVYGVQFQSFPFKGAYIYEVFNAELETKLGTHIGFEHANSQRVHIIPTTLSGPRILLFSACSLCYRKISLVISCQQATVQLA